MTLSCWYFFIVLPSFILYLNKTLLLWKRLLMFTEEAWYSTHPPVFLQVSHAVWLILATCPLGEVVVVTVEKKYKGKPAEPLAETLLRLMRRLEAARIFHGGLLVYRIIKFFLDFFNVSNKQICLWCVCNFRCFNTCQFWESLLQILAVFNLNYISVVYLDILPYRIIILCKH